MRLIDICGHMVTEICNRLLIHHTENMVVDGITSLEESLWLYRDSVLTKSMTERQYIETLVGLFAVWRIQYSTRMLSDGVDFLKEFMTTDAFIKEMEKHLSI